MNNKLPLIRIVDNDIDFRDGLEYLLKSHGYPVSSFVNGQDYLTKDRPFIPGIVLLDLRMPGLSGADVFTRIRERGWNNPVIFLTAFADVDIAVNAMKNGAVDFLQKPINPNRLFNTLNHAWLRIKRGDNFGGSSMEARLASLTERENNILHFLRKGLTSRDMALKFNISERTVEAHRRSINQKLGVHSLSELNNLLEK